MSDIVFALVVCAWIGYIAGLLHGGTKVREQYQRRLREERDDHAREIALLKLRTDQ